MAEIRAVLENFLSFWVLILPVTCPFGWSLNLELELITSIKNDHGMRCPWRLSFAVILFPYYQWLDVAGPVD